MTIEPLKDHNRRWGNKHLLNTAEEKGSSLEAEQPTKANASFSTHGYIKVFALARRTPPVYLRNSTGEPALQQIESRRHDHPWFKKEIL
jgi:hypothetical protein